MRISRPPHPDPLCSYGDEVRPDQGARPRIQRHLTSSAPPSPLSLFLCSGYIQLEELQTAAGLESYIVPSTWGNSAGLVGALTLAQLAADSERGTPISSTSRIAQLAAVAGAMAAAALVVTRRI